METSDWLGTYADPEIRAILPKPDFARTGRMADAIGKARHWSTIGLEQNIMQLKGWEAYGGSDPAERSRALDVLGFNCQLVLPSIAPGQFWGLFGQTHRNAKLLYGGFRALNRAITDFCSVGKRLLPVGFVPLDVPEIGRARTRRSDSSRMPLGVDPRNRRR
jgi:hypothetical protein